MSVTSVSDTLPAAEVIPTDIVFDVDLRGVDLDGLAEPLPIKGTAIKATVEHEASQLIAVDILLDDVSLDDTSSLMTPYYTNKNNAIENIVEDDPKHPLKWILYYVMPRKKRQRLLDDLHEEYEEDIIPNMSQRMARNWYRLQIFKSIYPLIDAKVRSQLEKLTFHALKVWWTRMISG